MIDYFFTDNDRSLDLSRKDKFGRTVLAAFFWDHQQVSTESEENKSAQILKLFVMKTG